MKLILFAYFCAKFFRVYETLTLGNGIRIIHYRVKSDVAHCCMLMNTGTRDESERQLGMAHFTEHMLFKGTGKRKAYHLLNRMESVGGEVDAYTTKEETCVSSSFLVEFYERAVELLNDVVFNSIFPQREIEKECDVIVDEINTYKDNPSENIFDEFESEMFVNHPLGHNILGTKKSISKFRTEDFLEFVGSKYNTDQMIFCSIGDIDFRRLVRICEKHLGQNAVSLRNFERLPFAKSVKFDKVVKKKGMQANTIIGNYCYSYSDAKRVPMFLLSNVLAGPGMNSRLNMQLREHHGLSYNIESNFTTYQDIGLFSIFFSSDHEKVDFAVDMIFSELDNFCKKKMGVLQLSKAKKQLIGQVAIECSSYANMLFPTAKSFLNYGKAETFKETVALIEAITAEDIMEVANEIFVRDKFSSIKYL